MGARYRLTGESDSGDELSSASGAGDSPLLAASPTAAPPPLAAGAPHLISAGRGRGNMTSAASYSFERRGEFRDSLRRPTAVAASFQTHHSGTLAEGVADAGAAAASAAAPRLRSSTTLSADYAHYLSTDQLTPIDPPPTTTWMQQHFLHRLLSDDWRAQFSATTDSRRLAKFHPEILFTPLPSLKRRASYRGGPGGGGGAAAAAAAAAVPVSPRDETSYYTVICTTLLDLVDCLRSNVAKNAMLALYDLLYFTADMLTDGCLERLIHTMLRKAASPSSGEFLVHEAQRSLAFLFCTDAVSLAKVVAALFKVVKDPMFAAQSFALLAAHGFRRKLLCRKLCLKDLNGLVNVSLSMAGGRDKQTRRYSKYLIWVLYCTFLDEDPHFIASFLSEEECRALATAARVARPTLDVDSILGVPVDQFGIPADALPAGAAPAPPQPAPPASPVAAGATGTFPWDFSGVGGVGGGVGGCSFPAVPASGGLQQWCARSARVLRASCGSSDSLALLAGISEEMEGGGGRHLRARTPVPSQGRAAAFRSVTPRRTNSQSEALVGAPARAVTPRRLPPQGLDRRSATSAAPPQRAPPRATTPARRADPAARQAVATPRRRNVRPITPRPAVARAAPPAVARAAPPAAPAAAPAAAARAGPPLGSVLGAPALRSLALAADTRPAPAAATAASPAPLAARNPAANYYVPGTAAPGAAPSPMPLTVRSPRIGRKNTAGGAGGGLCAPPGAVSVSAAAAAAAGYPAYTAAAADGRAA